MLNGPEPYDVFRLKYEFDNNFVIVRQKHGEMISYQDVDKGDSCVEQIVIFEGFDFSQLSNEELKQFKEILLNSPVLFIARTSLSFDIDIRKIDMNYMRFIINHSSKDNYAKFMLMFYCSKTIFLNEEIAETLLNAEGFFTEEYYRAGMFGMVGNVFSPKSEILANMSKYSSEEFMLVHYLTNWTYEEMNTLTFEEYLRTPFKVLGMADVDLCGARYLDSHIPNLIKVLMVSYMGKENVEDWHINPGSKWSAKPFKNFEKYSIIQLLSYCTLSNYMNLSFNRKQKDHSEYPDFFNSDVNEVVNLFNVKDKYFDVEKFHNFAENIVIDASHSTYSSSFFYHYHTHIFGLVYWLSDSDDNVLEWFKDFSVEHFDRFEESEERLLKLLKTIAEYFVEDNENSWLPFPLYMNLNYDLLAVV